MKPAGGCCCPRRIIGRAFTGVTCGWLLCFAAQAGPLHTRACVGDPCTEFCAESLVNHTSCFQHAQNVRRTLISQWEGDADAFAHFGAHGCGFFHAFIWQVSGCTWLGCNYGCAHANHHLTTSAASSLQPTSVLTNEVPLPPPARADSAHNFGFTDVEYLQQGSNIVFICTNQAARLQVDGNRHSPGDESFSRFDLTLDGLRGAISLHLKDGRVSLFQDGLFEAAPLRVEAHPSVSNLFLVRLLPAMNFQVLGNAETAEVALDLRGGRIPGTTNCIPLAIIGQPQNITNSLCSSNCVTFTVTATGSGPVNGQWFFNGAAISGATGPAHTVCPVTPANAGLYRVTISNGCSSITSQVARLLMLTDTQPPIIICPTNQTFWTCNTNTMQVFFPNPLATDNLDPNPTVTCTPGSGSFFPIGDTTVVCEAIDDCTNRNRCTFTVTVTKDVTPPVIACPSNIIVTAATPAGKAVNFSVTAKDDCDKKVDTICLPPSGSVFPAGLTTA